MRTGFFLFAILLGVSPAPAQDSAYIVVGKGKVAPLWTRVGEFGKLRLPKSARHDRVEGCVAVGFSIEPDGKPANLTVIRSAFTERAERKDIADVEQAVVSQFAGLRYVATAENAGHKPVYTYSSYSFSMFQQPATKDEVDARASTVSSPCDIADFPAAVARGDLVRKAAQ